MDLMILKFLQFTEKTWQPLPGFINPYSFTVPLNCYTDCMYRSPPFRRKPWLVPRTGHNTIGRGRNTHEYLKRFRAFLRSLPEPDLAKATANSDKKAALVHN